MIDPKKVSELSDPEKWDCTARWLNELYSAYWYILTGEMDGSDFIEEVNPCRYPEECPYYQKCPSTTNIPYRPTVPIPVNFRVMEQFTQECNVVSPMFPLKDIRHNRTVSPLG